MKRYLAGVVSGLEHHQIPYEVVQPSGFGLVAKYIAYPKMVWNRRKQKGKHLVISERYAYLIPLMGKDNRVICHDMHTLYPQAKTPWIHQRLYRFFLWCMFSARKVVCVSQHTKNDVLRFSPRFKRHKRLEVVPNGIEPFWSQPLSPNVDKEKWMKKFETHQILLSVGTDAWYKNNRWSLMLLKDLPERFHLLRIGNFTDDNQSFINQEGLKERITTVQAISDQQLKWAYHYAEALFFPSLSEGFGWPALEASLCGCPVVTDGHGAIEEVLMVKNIIPLEEAQTWLLNESHYTSDVPDFLSWNDQIERLLA